MIPRFKADFGVAELCSVLSPTRSRDTEVNLFETRFAAEFEQDHAIAMPYGRTGLVMLLKAFGFQGSEIICPAYTCLVVPEAIELSGNQVVFVDCVPSDYNVDFDLLDTAVTPRTRAFVATSIFGHPINADKLAAFRTRHPHIKVIQDCAHSFAARWEGHSVVTMGDAAFFGLNISKIISSIFGGVVTTNDAALAQALRTQCDAHIQRPTWTKNLMRRAYVLAVLAAFTRPVYGLVNWLEQSGALARFTQYYDETSVVMPEDYLVGMTAIEARVGRIQCTKYARIVMHRQALAQTYFSELEATEGLDFVLPPNVPGATYSHFAIRTPYASALIAHMRAQGVQLGHLIEYHCPDHAAFHDKTCIGSKRAAEWPGQMINLPLQHSLPRTSAQKLARQIAAFVAIART